MKKSRRQGRVSRREFLKGSLVGAAAMGLGPIILTPRRLEAYAAGEPTHPNISPLRVVGIADTRHPWQVVPLKPLRAEHRAGLEGYIVPAEHGFDPVVGREVFDPGERSLGIALEQFVDHAWAVGEIVGKALQPYLAHDAL